MAATMYDVPLLADSLLFAQIDLAVVVLTSDREFLAVTSPSGNPDEDLVPLPVDAPDELVGLLATTSALDRANLIDRSGAVCEAAVAAGSAFVAALTIAEVDGELRLVVVDVLSTPDPGTAEGDYKPRVVAAGVLTSLQKSVVALPWGAGAIAASLGSPDLRPPVLGAAAQGATSPWRYLPPCASAQAANANATSRTTNVAVAGDFIIGSYASGCVAIWDFESCAVVRDLGVVFPSGQLAAAVATESRLCLASATGTVKVYSIGGVTPFQAETQLRLCGRLNFPASALVAESGDDGYVVSILSMVLLDDARSAVLATALGVAVLDTSAMAWHPMYYFDAAARRASVCSSGCVGVEYVLDSECGGMLVLDPRVLAAPAAVAKPQEALAAPVAGALANGLVLPSKPDSDEETDEAQCEARDDAVASASFVGGRPVPAAWLEPLQAKRAGPAVATGKGAKPVTFGHRIRSSGYTNAVPWSVQQQKKMAEKKKAAQQAKTGLQFEVDVHYDTTAGFIAAELSKTSAILDAAKTHAGAVTGVAFGACGSVAVTASMDTTAFAMRQPPAQWRGEGWCLKGHTAPVLCCDAALGNRDADATAVPFATGSSDGEVRLWRPTKRPGATLVKNFGGKEVRAVKFLCDDALLGVAHGGTFSVLRYLLDLQVSDLDRQKNDSRALEVLAVPSGAQTVNSADAIGYTLSSKVVVGTSAKSVGIIDIGAGLLVSVFTDAHARAVHSVTAFSNSQFARLETPCHDLIASASTDGTVKLWDVRAGGKAAVRSFSSHSNTSMKVGLTSSPCGRYLAVGSEDRSVFIIDVGKGTAVARVPVPDVPGALRYSPTQPRLLVGCNSGAMRLLSPAD